MSCGAENYGLVFFNVTFLYLGRTRCQGGVTVSYIVVAVVDDAIIHVCGVILVAIGIVESCQSAQVGRGIGRSGEQVATQLVGQDSLVDCLLHTLQDTIDVEHGIHLLVQSRIINISVRLTVTNDTTIKAAAMKYITFFMILCF